jgi:hypothetical protein
MRNQLPGYLDNPDGLVCDFRISHIFQKIPPARRRM